MIKNDAGERWTIVHSDPSDPTVRRYPVPDGWLYQVELGEGDWHPPVFVPHLPQPFDQRTPTEEEKT